jgi:ubiquinone/menaquinone biosynthesis C-methylase UbiE
MTSTVLFIAAVLTSLVFYHVSNLLSIDHDLAVNLVSLGQHRAWRSSLLNSLHVTGPHASGTPPFILDVGCGTGDLAVLAIKGTSLFMKTSPHSDGLRGVFSIETQFERIAAAIKKTQKYVPQLPDMAQLADPAVVSYKSDDLLIEYRQRWIFDVNTFQDPSALFSTATMAFSLREVPEPIRGDALCIVWSRMKKEKAAESKCPYSGAVLTTPAPLLGILEASFTPSLLKNVIMYNVIPAVNALFFGKSHELLRLRDSMAAFPAPDSFIQEVQALRCTDDFGAKGGFKLVSNEDKFFDTVHEYVFEVYTYK